jgi:hypothetical protein
MLMYNVVHVLIHDGVMIAQEVVRCEVDNVLIDVGVK